MKNNRVIITGVTGAVGMALLKRCIQENCKILVICHRGSKRNQQIPADPKVSVLEADLCELNTLQFLHNQPWDIFYHMAWNGSFGIGRDNLALQISNIEGTLGAVHLAARLGCKTFVGLGSQAEYGRTEELLRPNTPAFPESGYGIAKLCAGQISRKACEQYGIDHIWVRLLSVYGPYDRAETMISTSLRQMLQGKETKFTPAEQLWDFLYSADAADALYKIGQYPIHGRVYCLGSGKTAPLKDYILEMKKLTGCKAKAGFGEIPYEKNQVMHLCADIRQLEEDIGFVPMTDFKSGIQRTIAWMRCCSQ